jgi:hypothetical protein
VTLTGNNFEPGMTVSSGSKSPTPQSLTPTRFTLDVGPQSVGNKNVVVTPPTGKAKQHLRLRDAPARYLQPHARGRLLRRNLTVTVAGSGFAQGLSEAFGSDNPTPTKLTPTSFEVEVGPKSPGNANVDISYPSATQAFTNFEFVNAKKVFVTSTVQNGNRGGPGWGRRLVHRPSCSRRP